ncbi:di-trans,poly-cis-decaprenylcistransferase [Candidatus Poribacteria bacterium]|nr:MAG: di-trans,poly-cis-decaprenylcistransferase [Candidatus Poribacteria bacterium]
MLPLQFIKKKIKQLFYALYQKRLEREASQWQIPYHIGIILDGNRRYAKTEGFFDAAKRQYGHSEGGDKLEEVLHWCDELGVKIVSIWICSLDNFVNRKEEEVEEIFNVIETKMRSLLTIEGLHTNQIKVRPMGELKLLPLSLQEAIRDVEEATKNYDKFILNVAVAYGGREEIVEAFRRYLKSELAEGKVPDEIAAELNADKIASHLYTSNLPDPDLIIRTSGEIRLSGFMLWQSAYSEYYFCDTYWPGFRKIDFLRAIRDYSHRERRFGR